MTSNMPIEQAATNAAKAASGPQPAVNDDGTSKLPTTQELLDQVTAQQQAESQARPDAEVQPTYTPNDEAPPLSSGVGPTLNQRRATEGVQAAPAPTFDMAAQKALMHSMSRYVKGQSRYIHDQNMLLFATEMENHIFALTKALEQLGVL